MAYQAKRKSKNAGKPRTYRGKKVIDVTDKPMTFVVTNQDCKRGKPNSPEGCAGALAIKRKVLGDTHPDTALTACNYASLLLDMGRVEQAQEQARHGLTALEATLPQSHPRVRAAQEILSRCVSI